MRSWISCAFLVVLLAVPAEGQGPAKPLPEPPGRPEGAQIFRTWCASCHGISGQGNGPLAPMLRRMPPDLTQLAAANGGVFPVARIRRIVDGRDVQSHGDPEMPVWGTAFKSTKDGFSDESVRARIDAVVAYVETIQKRNAQ